VGGRPWIARAAPERVAALKGEKCLWDVRLGEDDGACCAERRDDLYSMGGSVRVVFELWRGWQNETYGGVLLGRLIGPLCIPYRTIEPLHVDYPHLVNNLKKKGEWEKTYIGPSR
jgi:hypothetical protein